MLGRFPDPLLILLTQPWVSEYDPIFCNRHPFLLQHLHFLSSFSIFIIYTVYNIIWLIKLSQIPAYCSISAQGFSLFFFSSKEKRLRARLPISLAHLTFSTNYNSLRNTSFWSQFYLYLYVAAKGRSEMLQNEVCADTTHAWLKALGPFWVKENPWIEILYEETEKWAHVLFFFFYFQART